MRVWKLMTAGKTQQTETAVAWQPNRKRKHVILLA